ncbi:MULTISPECIES: hypothetical protein [Hymenobacter]|uniref:Uncharacterized protein n=1 Tax=Hymenobacter mucosus TaxID=1411120 RepID=A0A238VYA2_9BACT|nr:MULTISPECIES: hypothetical protein [Hymenobacter]SNR39292.1 hypothetical protein SAMN06269173_10244 [Hymenobacter mucosus]
MSTPAPDPNEQKKNQTTESNEAPQPGSQNTTQSTLTDGDGIRGGYGDSDQTNGLEGGEDAGPDGSPTHDS